jgi:hypothetical protein
MSFMYEQSTLKPKQYTSNFYHIKQAVERATQERSETSQSKLYQAHLISNLNRVIFMKTCIHPIQTTFGWAGLTKLNIQEHS